MTETALILVVIGVAYICNKITVLVRDVHEIADLIRSDITDKIEYHLKELVHTNGEIFLATKVKGDDENISDTLLNIKDKIAYLKYEWDKKQGYI